MGKFRFAAAAIAVAASLSAGAVQARQISIGSIIYARDSQFWQQVEKGMQDAAKKYDVDLAVSLNQRQLSTEAQVVENFMTRQVDAIIMPPLDAQASMAAARRAAKQGVTVIDYDAPFNDPGIAKHTIGVDSFELAAEVTAKMRESLDEKGGGKVALITLPPTNPNMKVRRDGAMSNLKGDDIEVVSEVAAATPDAGASALETILQRTPDISAVWASNSGSLSGSAAAAKRIKSDVKLYGVDMSVELAKAMLDPNGKVYAVSDQQPYKVGYSAVETAVQSLTGKNPPRKVLVPVKVYSRDDPKDVQSYIDFVESLGK
ncbi:sugar ABC transporter substrate-binding protein [Aurantimonas sp. VKM B-3413]|uniref:sugar ABC transporter substrate-binding protein n=1 Tax=Aurantimonas sp. VKM B-3413 TaxID=2779401 RepID=UPI001E51E2DB|nr:sugar ABC transporter substrate-binding protein [Aurantimonas sp. VKM B-3413]MCB8838065.1 sugar ABC transporter substrate-binding protein [Aurantimonas sp. VKM B-3413]